MQVETKLRKLCLEDQQCQGIDEATEHPLGHEPHLIGKSQIAPGDLKKTGHQTRHHQVLHTEARTPCLSSGHKACHQQSC